MPDAWVDESKTKVGYEINFNRYFYKYVPPRPLEEIEADIRTLETEIVPMLGGITGRANELERVVTAGRARLDVISRPDDSPERLGRAASTRSPVGNACAGAQLMTITRERTCAACPRRDVDVGLACCLRIPRHESAP